MPDQPPTRPWHGIPASKTGSTCQVYLMQAGGLAIPNDLAILHGPNKVNTFPKDSMSKDLSPEEWYFAPDFVFLIEHSATGDNYLFDLGMRHDLQNSPPAVVNNTLPLYKCSPESPVDILRDHGTSQQQASTVKAVIFSHLHFDHIGDAGKAGFQHAELWIGPSSCTSVRPGYPADPNGIVFSDDLPEDGSKKIVEFKLPSNMLDDKREGVFESAVEKGNYEGIELREPSGGWFGLGAFDRAFDLFNDGSVYLIDAPGHTPGHQMLMVKVKTGFSGVPDDFVLLSGDCFHHPAMLRDPLRTARPPFSELCMHSDPEVAIDTMFRARRCAMEDNIWVVGAHDFSIVDALTPGSEAVEGLVLLTDWREKDWKR